METGMKAWLAVAAAGAVAVSILGLPPSMPRWEPWRLDAQLEHAGQLRAEMMGLNRELQLIRVGDSIRGAIALDDAAAEGISIRRSIEPKTEQLPVVEGSLRHDAGLLENRSQDVLLAGWTLPADQGSHDAVDRRASETRLEWFGGVVDDGRSYCAVAVALEDRAGVHHELNLPVHGSRLGPCAYWARFGPPGPHVATWLARGGADFTVGHEVVPSFADSLAEVSSRPFGLRVHLGVGPAVEPCLQGVIEVCRAAFLFEHVRGSRLPDEARGAVEAGYLGRMRSWRRHTFGDPGTLIMADLERDFGEERMRRFWTSDQPVDVAFQTAFGVEVGSWTRTWATRYFPPLRAGQPLPSPLSALSVFAVLGLAAGIAGRAARRRQVV